MSALDACEPQVIRALEKDGWQIVKKPYRIISPAHTVLADVMFQGIIDNEVRQVVILEVKCFTDPQNDLNEIYTAVGQYLYYRSALTLQPPTFPLYLALPLIAYERLLLDPVVQLTFQAIQMKLVVVDVEIEEIVQWIH
jgi:hypothetical protein